MTELHMVTYINALENRIRELEANKLVWMPCDKELPENIEATYLICTNTGYMCSCRWTNDRYGLGATELSEWGWCVLDVPQYSIPVAWMALEPWKGIDNEYI